MSLYVGLLATLLSNFALAQRPVSINDQAHQYIFSFQEIEFVEDAGNDLSIDEVSAPGFSKRFSPSLSFSPENYNRASAYWYRIRVRHDPQTKHEWKLEFFDQTIDRIDFYIPDGGSGFVRESFGDSFPFYERPLRHKNFFVKLPGESEGIQTYYFKVKSRQQANILLVLRTSD